MSHTQPDLSPPHAAAQDIQSRRPGFVPKVGIVLGSGLGSLAETLEDSLHIPYSELRGFPSVTVKGHGGTLSLGFCAGTPVVFLQGRAHGYEGNESHALTRTCVRTLKLLGCEYFIATNASGSLRLDAPPGSLMLINDHINLQPTNPLVGPNDEAFGPRFLPLDNAYDKGMREHLHALATARGITLHDGVYLAVLGPNYETAAEIRAFRTLGADAVGMSTVPEVLVANHCGMRVAVIATMTNYATGLADTAHSHDAVVATAAKAAEQLGVLLKDFMASLS